MLVEQNSYEGKKAEQTIWDVFRLHHQRSRYVYDMYYKREAITRELYDWLLREKYADGNLIAKWKKVYCCPCKAPVRHLD